MKKTKYKKIQGFDIIPSNFYIVDTDTQKLKIHAQSKTKKLATIHQMEIVINDLKLYNKITCIYYILKGEKILQGLNEKALAI